MNHKILIASALLIPAMEWAGEKNSVTGTCNTIKQKYYCVQASVVQEQIAENERITAKCDRLIKELEGALAEEKEDLSRTKAINEQIEKYGICK